MRKIWLVGVLVAGALVIPAPAQAQTTCNGLPVTIPGGPGPDVINGTAGNDVIAAEAGDDIVSGLDGNDTICPGAGDDLIAGGADNDTVAAEAGVDGADQFAGGAGRDRVTYSLRTAGVTVSLDNVANDGAPGEGDNNFIDVEDISGGESDDQLFGSALPNALSGGSGKDTINGGFGADSITGGRGDDALAGQGDNDFVFGNGDNDTFIAGAGRDGADFFEGGSGIDTADYSARFVTLTINLDNVANDGSAGEADDLRLDVENVTGGTSDDVIIARGFQPNPNRLVGGPGNDILDSRDAPFLTGDTVDGGLFGRDFCNSDPDDTEINCEF